MLSQRTMNRSGQSQSSVHKDLGSPKLPSFLPSFWSPFSSVIYSRRRLRRPGDNSLGVWNSHLLQLPGQAAWSPLRDKKCGCERSAMTVELSG